MPKSELSRIALSFVLLTFLLPGTALAQSGRVTLLQFSDYHSHAVPFFADGRHGWGGIARAVAYLREAKRDRRVLVFSGGDMINRASPAWSDKYQCAEWPWLNGILDAMALGNHDADYGPDVFDDCQKQIRYPILASNLLDAEGKSRFVTGGKPYSVFRVGNLRVGVFALAGTDYERLTKAETRPAGIGRVEDRAVVARSIVSHMRENGVNVVVLIGHAHRDEDFALARSVPGIDIIFGSHSHIREELHKIAGSATWFISPFQYLTHIARVDLELKNGKLIRVRGGLVPMSPDRPVDRRVASHVTRMQRQLEGDPKYGPLFESVGIARSELGLDDSLREETVLANFVLDVVRVAAGADVALSTASSFRQSLAPGTIVLEDLRASLPYPNKILLYEISGIRLREILDLSVKKRGSDSFGQISGVRLNVRGGRLLSVEIDRGDQLEPLQDEERYTLATTDYLALVAPGYRDLLREESPRDTGLEVRETVRQFIRRSSPVSGKLDGRMRFVE